MGQRLTPADSFLLNSASSYKVASHEKILDWWAANSKNTNLYIGNGPYKIRNNSDKAWDKKKELPNQLTLSRNSEAVTGNVFFSAKSLMQNNADVVKYLKKKYYKRKALSPISPFAEVTGSPEIKLESIQTIEKNIRLKFNDLKGMRYAMVYPSGKNNKAAYPIKKLLTKTFLKKGNQIDLEAKLIKNKNHITIIFIDKFRHESEPKIIHLKQTN